MHAEDFEDWEASLETYFEWKPMEEARKVLFIKLKIKGNALQWWKRVEEQRVRQGKQKISTWEHMRVKLRKQFLPADYMIELYERFHTLKQKDMSIEEYTFEFNNLSIRVGLNENNEQLTARYLSGLNQSIRDEMGVVRLFNLEDAHQYALMAERRVLRYGNRKTLGGRSESTWKKNTSATQGFQNEQSTYKSNRDTANNFQSDEKQIGADRKGHVKEFSNFRSHHSPGSRFPRAGSGGNGAQTRCFSCGESGHMSYAYPQRRVNLAEVYKRGKAVDPVYDEYPNAEEEAIDLLLVQRESLMVKRVLTTPKIEEEDWNRRNIFRTRFLCGGKACNVILDGGSTKNIISKEAVEKLMLLVEKHPDPYKISWFRKGNEVPITSRCLVKISMADGIESEVWCDVVPMDTCYILLGRPWFFDMDMIHHTRANTYSFYKDGKKLTLQPLEEVMFANRKISGLISARRFEVASNKTGSELKTFNPGIKNLYSSYGKK